MKYTIHTTARDQTVSGILAWCKLLQGTASKVAIYKAFQKCLPGGNLKQILINIGCVEDPFQEGQENV